MAGRSSPKLQEARAELYRGLVRDAAERTEQTAMWRNGVEATAAAMREGIAQGLLVDENPDVMARAAAAMQQAHLGYWLEHGMREPAADVIARLQRHFVRSFCPPDTHTVPQGATR